ncbi:MAG: DinB family protein [Gemmataceae bacterium]|nr:DinB family protein [Gemmataceae bacterium]
MTPNDVIAASFRIAKGMLHRFADDLSAADFRHAPVPGANSAGWIVAHLALTFRRVAEKVGATDLPAVPDGLPEMAKTTGLAAAGEPPDFGPPADLLRFFDACADAATAAVRNVPPDQLAGPMPFKVPFAGNLAEGLLFVGGLHMTMHVGQLTLIRRSLGKPPVV